MPASGAHSGARVAGVLISAWNLNRLPLLPTRLPWDLLGRPGLAWRGGEEFGYLTGSQPLWTQRGPAGGGPGNRCPSPPALERSSWANGRKSDAPGLVHRSADHCGNPGGGEQGRRRCPGGVAGGAGRGGCEALSYPGVLSGGKSPLQGGGGGRREGTPWGHLEAERKV